LALPWLTSFGILSPHLETQVTAANKNRMKTKLEYGEGGEAFINTLWIAL